MQSSNENMINFKPDIDFVDPETIQISKHNGIPYLIITEPIHSERFEGYSVLIHSLKDITMSFVLLYFVAIAFGLLATFIMAGISYIFNAIN